MEIMAGDKSKDAPPLHLEEESANTELPLPAAFLEFLKTNGIDPSLYSAAAAKDLPRYVRLKPGVESEIPEIENEIGFKLKPVSWLSGFFSIAQQAKIASSEAYRQGKAKRPCRGGRTTWRKLHFCSLQNNIKRE